MREYYQERFKMIAEKTIKGKLFTLELHERLDPDSYNEDTKSFLSLGYDYIISGPNWLSGYLKAQGFNELEVFNYFDQVTMEDVSAAWEARNEKALFSSYGN